MKKITALLLAVICLFSFAACSSDDTTAPQTGPGISYPAIYDMKILSVNGEDITYEYYRYYYLFVKNTYAEGGTQLTDEKIKEEVVEKLRYDAAIHNLLKKYSQSLTEEEIKECEEYVGMYVSAYGEYFLTQLETEMNMTLDVFKKSTINEMAYNKLYTYLADEKNMKLDFSNDAVAEYMKDFKAGMHLILKVDDEKNDAATKELMNKLYAAAQFDSAFEPILKIHELRNTLAETQKTIDEINKQIADGKASAELTATLSSLLEQINEISKKITEEQSKVDVIKCLENYMEKLDIYREIIKKEINSLANSNDADFIAGLDTKEISEICAYIASASRETIAKKLTDELSKLSSNKTNYGWFPADFVSGIDAFSKSYTAANLENIINIYKGNNELKKDKDVVALMTACEQLAVLFKSDATAGQCHDSLEALNGTLDISVDFYEKSALYAALRSANAVAEELKSYEGDDIHTKVEENYAVLSAPITTFEELVIKYSADYEEESGSAVFYMLEDNLIDELNTAIKGLKAGEMTDIVKSSAGYHLLKLVDTDVEYFKKNEYAYYVIEDMINAELENVKFEGAADVYDAINTDKIKEYEKELSEQKKELSNNGSSENVKKDGDNTVLWTVIIIGVTIAVVGVLVVLIVLAGKPEPSHKKNYSKNNAKGKKKK